MLAARERRHSLAHAGRVLQGRRGVRELGGAGARRRHDGAHHAWAGDAARVRGGKAAAARARGAAAAAGGTAAAAAATATKGGGGAGGSRRGAWGREWRRRRWRRRQQLAGRTKSGRRWRRRRGSPSTARAHRAGDRDAACERGALGPTKVPSGGDGGGGPAFASARPATTARAKEGRTSAAAGIRGQNRRLLGRVHGLLVLLLLPAAPHGRGHPCATGPRGAGAATNTARPSACRSRALCRPRFLRERRTQMTTSDDPSDRSLTT